MSAPLLFLDIGGGEFLLIGLVILIFFGPGKIPELARGLGKGIREFKDATNEIRSEFERAATAPPPPPAPPAPAPYYSPAELPAPDHEPAALPVAEYPADIPAETPAEPTSAADVNLPAGPRRDPPTGIPGTRPRGAAPLSPDSPTVET